MFLLVYVLVFIPIIFGWKPLVVISGSMEPTLKVGGLLYYKKIDLDDFKKNDILVFQSAKHIVSHRIVEKNEYGFITKGDANKNNDNNLVNNTYVLGKGTNWCIPYLGYYVSFLYNNKIIMFFVICLFCFLNYKEKKKIKSNLAIVFVLFLSCQFCYSFFNSSSSISNDLKTNSYNIKLFTNGGTLINDLKINKDVILPNIKKNGFSFNGWKKMSDGYHAEWIDNIPPVITNFRVENLGYYNPSLGARAGWNIRIYVDAYDNGSGIRKYQTWLVPYKNGSGAGREDGGERILTNVLYLNTQEGRTFCAYAIDNAGNESEKCETIKV